MKIIQHIAIALAVVASLAMIKATSSPVYAGPNVARQHYCLTYDTGGLDCSFIGYPQCLATTSGIDAECYGKTVRNDDRDGIHKGHGGLGRSRR